MSQDTLPMAHRTHLLPRLLASPVFAPPAVVPPARAVVMLQLSDHPAMPDAIHAACQIARRDDAMLALVAMVPVAHPGWLGSPLGDAALPPSIGRLQRQALVTAEDYGVFCAVTRYPYTTWAEGMAQAAELWGAATLIAARPRRALPGWNVIEAWLLRRQLTRQGCAWHEAPFRRSP